MNLNHLAIFHAVAEAGNITAAAERLCISQPAVSKQLQELERSLGAPLFDRLPRGVRLTEAGSLLAGYAGRLFALESEAELALAELQGLERGRLAVGASATIGGYLLPDLLVRFHQLYPAIELFVEIANTEAIHKQLLTGVLDIGFTEGSVDLDSELATEVFMEDELVVIAAADHPILGEAPVMARRLAQDPFVVREPGSGTRDIVEGAFAASGLAVRPVMSLGNIEAIKRAVAAGAGLAVVSSLTVGLEIAAGKLAVVQVADLKIRRALHIAGVSGRHQSRAARALADVVRRPVN